MEQSRLLSPLIARLISGAVISVEEGARTMITLAGSAEVVGVSGKYFVREKAVRSDPATYDRETAKRLWDVSAEMTGVDFFR